MRKRGRRGVFTRPLANYVSFLTGASLMHAHVRLMLVDEDLIEEWRASRLLRTPA